MLRGWLLTFLVAAGATQLPPGCLSASGGGNAVVVDNGGASPIASFSAFPIASDAPINTPSPIPVSSPEPSDTPVATNSPPPVSSPLPTTHPTKKPTAPPTSPPPTQNPSASPSPSPTPTVAATTTPLPTAPATSPPPSSTPRPTAPATSPPPSSTPRPTEPASPSPSPSPSATATATPNIAFGLYIANVSTPGSPQSLAQWSSLYREPNYTDAYSKIGNGFPVSNEAYALANNVGIVETWSDCSLANVQAIIAHQDDAAIITHLQAYLANENPGQPVNLRWCWEFNLSGKFNNGSGSSGPPSNTPEATAAQFQQAWQVIWHDIHDPVGSGGVGATSAQIAMFWCPSGGVNNSSILSFYPGDAYVDHAGWDKYDESSQGFLNDESAMYSLESGSMSPIGATKDFWVGETGELQSGNQGTYLTYQTRAQIAAQYPRIKNIIYFDSDTNGNAHSLNLAGVSALGSFQMNTPEPAITPPSSPSPSPSPSASASPSPSPSPSPTATATAEGFIAPPEPLFAPNPFATSIAYSNDPYSASELAQEFTTGGPFINSTPAPSSTALPTSNTWEISVPVPGDTLGEAAPTYPVYYCDHTVCRQYTITCTLYGGGCPLSGQSVWLRPGAMPEDGYTVGGEGHEAFVNALDGVVDALYGVTSVVPSTGNTFTVGWAGKCAYNAFVVASAACNEGDTAGGLPIAGMLIRPDEWLAASTATPVHDLGHPIAVTACARNAAIWPSISANGETLGCPPNGAIVKLNKTDAWINAQSVPKAVKVLLLTKAHYGDYVTDQNAMPQSWYFEDDNDRTSLGQTGNWPAMINELCTVEDPGLNCSGTIRNGAYHIYLPLPFAQTDLQIVYPSVLPTPTAPPTAAPSPSPSPTSTAGGLVYLIPQGLNAVEALETSSPQAVQVVWNQPITPPASPIAYENGLSVGATVVDTLPNAAHDIYSGCADDGNEGVATTVTFATPNPIVTPNPNPSMTAAPQPATFTINNPANIAPEMAIAFMDGNGTQELVNVASISGNVVTTDGSGFANVHPTNTAIPVQGACPHGIGTGAWSVNELLNRQPNIFGSPAPTSTDSSGNLVITLKQNGVVNNDVHVDAVLYDDEKLNAAFQTPPIEYGQAIKYGQQVCAEIHASAYTNHPKCILTPGGSIYQKPATSGTYVCTSTTPGWNGGLPSYDGQQGQCRQFAYLLPLMAQDIVTGGHADIIDSQAQGLQGNCDTDSGCTEFLNATYLEGHLLKSTNTLSLVGVGTGSGGNNECYTYNAIDRAMYGSAIDPNGGLNAGFWFNIHSIPAVCNIPQNDFQQAESAIEYLAAGAPVYPSPYPTANPTLSISATTPSSSTKSVNLAAAVGFNGWMKYAYSGYATGAAEDDTFTPVMPVANFSPLPTAVNGNLSSFIWTGGEVDTIYKSGTDSYVLQWPAVNGHSETLTLPASIVPQQANVYLEQTCAPITVTATLSDGSATPQTTTLPANSNGATFDSVVTVNFAADTNGQTLAIVAKSGAPLNSGSCSGSGTVGLQALGMGSLATPTPSPSPTSTATASPSPSPTATASPSPSPTSTATVSPSPSPTATSTSIAQMGAFYRIGTAPFGSISATAGTNQPNPYPTYAGNLTAYMTGADTSGNSIVSANPLDATKLANILGLGVQWVRQTDSPFGVDTSHEFGSGSYVWGQVDATLYAAKQNNNFTPVIGFEVGPVEYNDATSGFNPQSHYRYDTPTAFAGYCSALAAHASTIFGDHVYSIPGNELNSGTGAINGAPPMPVLNLTTGGTLPIGTAVQYRITGLINGVESIASPEYVQTETPTSGHQSVVINWGPLAAETGGYRIYGRTAGSEQLLATVAHGVLTYTDTGSGTPSGALPTSSTTLVSALEADWAVYTKDCYQAIKAADSQAVVYGGELSMDGGLSPYATQFVSDEVALGCGPGTCYDGISMHLTPVYPQTSGPCYPAAGGGYRTSCFDAMEVAAGATVPLMESEYVVTWPGMVTNESTKALAITNGLTQMQPYPNVKYISYANVDECSLYPSGYFENGCLIDVNQNKLASYSAARPFYPSPSPTSTATATPGPSASPYINAISTDHPWFYSPLNAPAGSTTTADLGSGGNTAHYVGVAAPTEFPNTPPPGPYSPGGSTSNAIFLPNPTSNYPSTAAMTMEGWITPAAPDFAFSYDSASIVDNRDPATSSTWFNLGIHGDTAGSGHAVCQFQGSGIEADSPASSISAGGLYYLACSYNQTVGTTLYVNGVSAGTSSATYFTPWGSGNPGIAIGGLGSSATAGTIQQGSLSGTVSNVGLYTTALSSARILAHYNAGIANVAPTPTPSPTPSPTPPPVALGAPVTGPYAGASAETALCINGNTQVNAEPTIPPGYGTASGHHMGEFGQPGYTRALLALYWESGSTRIGTVGASFSTGNTSPITTLASNVTIPAQDGATTATFASASGFSVGNLVELGHSPGNNGNNASSADAPTSLIATITGISGNTISLGSARDYPHSLPLDTSGIIASGLGVWKVTGYSTWTGDSESYGRTGGGYDNYLAGGATDTSGLPDPFAIGPDTAVAGSPQGLSITAQPVPTAAAYPNESPVESHYTAMTSQNATPEPWPAVGGSIAVTVGSSQENAVQNDFPVTIGSTGSGKVAVGWVLSGANSCNHQSGVCTSGTGGVITIAGIVYLEGSQSSGSATFPTGTNMEEVNWVGNSSGAIDKQMDFQYGFLAAKTRTPANLSDNSIAFWTLDSQKPYTPNPPAGGLKRNEMDIQEQFGNTIGDAQNMGQLSWDSNGNGITKGYWLGDFESGAEGGVYSDQSVFGSNNSNYPSNAYHEYGGLWTPQVDGNGNFGVPGVQTNFANGGAPPSGNACCQNGNGVTTAGDSGYVDGIPNPGHIGTADLTENTAGKEVIAIFQIENGAPDDVAVTTTTNSFVVPNAYASTVNVTVASFSGWIQMLGKQYDIHSGTGVNEISMRAMLVGVNNATSTLTFYSMADITAGGSNYGSTIPSGATVTAAGERSHTAAQQYWVEYIRQYTPMTSGGACT